MEMANPNNGTAEPRAKRASWLLKLYVAGQTPRSQAALGNLTRLCEMYLRGLYEIEVVDLLLNPTVARRDQIVAIPSLVRYLPAPVKKIVGDLANEERVLSGLDILTLNEAILTQSTSAPL